MSLRETCGLRNSTQRLTVLGAPLMEHLSKFLSCGHVDTIERELREAGFDVIELAGDFNGKPLSPTQDESIVVVARRKRHRPVSKRKRAVYP